MSPIATVTEADLPELLPLMRGFNAFHEQVYQTVKDRVNGKNDIIHEVAKFLFLESFRLHHRDFFLFVAFCHSSILAPKTWHWLPADVWHDLPGRAFGGRMPP